MFIPNLTPLLCSENRIFTQILYEKKFTTVDDVSHDEEHIHDFYEIYVNLAGDVSFLVENNVYKISKGDIIMTRPNDIHKCIYNQACVHEHFCIWLENLDFCGNQLEEKFENHFVTLSKEKKLNFIDNCFALNKAHKENGEMLLKAKCFFNLLDILYNADPDVPKVQNLPEGFSHIVEFINEHYTEPTCTTKLLCDEFYTSKSTLCRQFAKHFQTTPSDYIQSKRFGEAKKLLRQGMSVQDACFSSGFSDCSYFIMRFRKKFGITPHKYKKG